MTSKDLELETRTAFVKEQAAQLGFLDCRVARATMLEDEARNLESWLLKGNNAGMDYMSNHFDLRIDPSKLVPGAKSVIVLALNYFPSTTLEAEIKLSKYAYGRDYHKVIRKKLKAFIRVLESKYGSINGRGFVDSAPVMEKAWAVRSGIGWMGKHTNVLTKQMGSFYFLSVLISDLELLPDSPVTDHCGSCTACIDACPTNALQPYELDANKCISYLTIELKDEVIDPSFKDQMEGWAFGCDICQDVCPWNRFSKPHSMSDFEPKETLQAMTDKDWVALTEQRFNELFEGSAVKRTKYNGLKRNIEFLSS